MILVTGGTGFLGAYIIKHLLLQGHQVRAIRRNMSKLPFFISPELISRVEWVEGDILDVVSLEEAMTGIDAVIHAAAKVSFEAKEIETLFKINVEGTANMVNIAVEKNIRRFIYISSVAALGRTATGETIDEEKEWQETKINTSYAISKYKAELEVWRAMGEGLQGVILNPSTILGYGDWNTSSCAIFKTVYNEFPYYSSGINGFVYVEDVARATVQLLESNITSERFIINSDNWCFRQLFNGIADGFNKRRPHRNATPSLAAIAWRAEKLKSFFTGKRSLLSKESARIAQSKTNFDNRKLLKFFPDFTYTSLEVAIQKSCEEYTKNAGG
jgi:dihydroflavonol-4-reductase